jgi:hypothetical protein
MKSIADLTTNPRKMMKIFRGNIKEKMLKTKIAKINAIHFP